MDDFEGSESALCSLRTLLLRRLNGRIYLPITHAYGDNSACSDYGVASCPSLVVG